MKSFQFRVTDLLGIEFSPVSHVERIVSGAGHRTSGICTRTEFGRWAKHEVVRYESSWQRFES